tara:strand:+ start:143 stop:343 length:201 start_codon:yes stop_codon:yes gene_type:complete
MVQTLGKCERINTNLEYIHPMTQSSKECVEESTRQQQQQQQQSYSETKLNASEIEKLYLRIKEDWL